MVDDNVRQNIKWYDVKDKSKRNVRLANDIENKVNALKMKRYLRGTMGANLSDICIRLDDYIQLVNKFLEVNPEDKKTMGDILVEIRVCLEEIKYNCSHVIKTLDKVADYCYEGSRK
jgi:hypothetical protein